MSCNRSFYHINCNLSFYHYTFCTLLLSFRFIQSQTLFHISTHPLTTPIIFITPEAILWLSFYIIYSFGQLLHTRPTVTVTPLALKRSTMHYRISFFFSSDSLPHYTTLPHFYYHLHRLHHFLSYIILFNSTKQHMSQHSIYTSNIFFYQIDICISSCLINYSSNDMDKLRLQLRLNNYIYKRN